MIGALDATLEGRDVDDRMVAEAASDVTRAVGRLDQRAIADRNPIPALAPDDDAAAARRRRAVASRICSARTSACSSSARSSTRSQWAARFRAALETISKIESLEERRLLLAETLDCCSHRLDAWMTAAATRRLRELRAGGAHGTFIGAYGWLENIELRHTGRRQVRSTVRTCCTTRATAASSTRRD